MDTLNLNPVQVKALQHALNVAHGAGLKEDGILGPKTLAAIDRFGDASSDGIQTSPLLAEGDEAPVDTRSEAIIATLLPEVQPLMRAVINRVNALANGDGLTLVATSGTRSYAEQDALYHQRPKVTNAPGGYSNHNFGLACDFTFFRGHDPVWDSPHYHDQVGVVGKALGLFWGGDWKSIDDEPHLELRPNWAADITESAMLAQLRNRKAEGSDLLA